MRRAAAAGQGIPAGPKGRSRRPAGNRTGGPEDPSAARSPAAAGSTAGAGSTAAPPAVTGFVRTCESSVYGELERDWRRQSVAVGPLSFAYLRKAANWLLDDPPGKGGLYSRKTLITVDGAASVTVTVPPADRRHFSLLYDPADWRDDSGTYRVSDGDPVVTFQGCPPDQHPYGADHTQFNGGLLIDGPRCVTLEVSTPAWRTPRQVTASFGAGRCRS